MAAVAPGHGLKRRQPDSPHEMDSDGIRPPEAKRQKVHENADGAQGKVSISRNVARDETGKPILPIMCA